MYFANLNLRELSEYTSQFLIEVGLRKLNLPHVERPDPGDLVVPA